MKIETHCYKYDIVLKKDNHEQWVDIYKINPFTSKLKNDLIILIMKNCNL